MLTENHYINGLLLLSYLIAAADGVVDDIEMKALKTIAADENVAEVHFLNFMKYAKVLPEKSIYTQGLDELAKCSQEENLRAFCWLYRISEVDGKVHIKEVRFLLYSLKKAGLNFEDVLEEVKKFPSLF